MVIGVTEVVEMSGIIWVARVIYDIGVSTSEFTCVLYSYVIGVSTKLVYTLGYKTVPQDRFRGNVGAKGIIGVTGDIGAK